MALVRTHELHPAASHEASDQVYNGLDACITLEVHEELSRLSNREPECYNFERALQAPLLEMMLRGFRIDEFERQKSLGVLSESLAQVNGALQVLARAVWDRELNPRSHPQLVSFFYDAMRLPREFRSRKGVRKLSMDRETLEKLDAYFYARPIIAAILSYRDIAGLMKKIATSLDADMRWRTSYNMATETGRLSSSKSAFGTGDNTQNLKRDDEDEIARGVPSIRKMFIADQGFKLVNLDLEQTESFDVGWLHGTLLNDWTYLDSCEKGDLHTQVARMVWPDLPWTGNLRDDRKIADRNFYRNYSYRDMAKRGGHLTNYMGTEWTMARSLKIPQALAQRFQDAYATGQQAAFPAFPKWWRYCAQELQSVQRLVTPYGRERQFFGRPREDATLREAIAYVPQSMTADRMNLGLWRIWKHLGHRVQVLAQVHDSVAFQFREGDNEQELITRALELTKVPLTNGSRTMTVGAEAKIGWNWGAYDAKANPDGLVKWSSTKPDSRERTKVRTL